MKIGRDDLINWGACIDGIERFDIAIGFQPIAVGVEELLDTVVTVNDLIWLSGRVCTQEKVVQFSARCARKFTEDSVFHQIGLTVDQIAEFLDNPTKDSAELVRSLGLNKAANSILFTASSVLANSPIQAAVWASYSARDVKDEQFIRSLFPSLFSLDV